MTDNLRIWNALSKTDPKHTKPFKRSGGFSGTATKPIWLTMRLTEQFGPAGTGWGMEKPEFQTVPGVEGTLVYCTVALWYEKPTQKVYGVGGDKVVGKNKYGPFDNDEAFKAAYTDALSNAMKQIGVAADIHMGLFDDSKYRREIEQEFASGNGVAPFASNALEQASREITEMTGNTESQYKVDKRKAAVAAGWKTTNKTYKGCVDQIFGYIDMAGTVEEVSAILNANEGFIEKAQPIDKEEIEAGAANLIKWLEGQASTSHAA